MRKTVRRSLTWESLEARVVLNGEVTAAGSIRAASNGAEIATRAAMDTATPTRRDDGANIRQHADNLAQVGAGNASNIVFFGDSITARFGLFDGPGVPVWNRSIAPMGAVNFGLDGDRTQNILWRMQDGELNGQPKVVVVQVGTNNLLFSDKNGTPGETVAGIAAVVRTIRTLSPRSKVLLLGLLPRGTPDDPVRSSILQVNSQVANLRDGDHVAYLDLGALFLRPDGTIPAALMPDGLHPSELGYRLMADALQAPLHERLGLPVPDPTSYGGPILIDLPADRVIEAPDERGALLRVAPPLAFDGLDPRPVVTSNPPRGTILPRGTTVVTWTATDRHGHVASATINVEVRPGAPPVLHGVPAEVAVEATSSLGRVVNFATPTATDDSDPHVRVLCVPSSGSTFPVGTTVVACTAVDEAGHVTTATFLVIVRDTSPPAFVSVPDLSIEATGASGAPVNLPPIAVVDLVDPAPSVLCSPPSGSVFSIGTTVVTCTAMDRLGNVSTTTFKVTVRDTPVLRDVPSSIVVEATGALGAVVAYAAPTADSAANPSIRVTNSRPSGSTFPIGTTVVTSFARGVSGVATSVTFTVTVVPRANVSTVSALSGNAMARAAAAIGSSSPSRPRRGRKPGALDYRQVAPSEANADARALLDRADANRDLQLTQKELGAFISARVDRNRDRKVSLYEQTLAIVADPQGTRLLFPDS